MGHCRFENTARDLADCLEAIRSEGLESLSKSERYQAERLLNLCREFAQALQDENT